MTTTRCPTITLIDVFMVVSLRMIAVITTR